MTASTKLHQLESKISELQKQHQLLLKERQTEIASLISMAGLAKLDEKTLMEGFLFLKEKITTQDPIMEAWNAAGEKFLRQNKPKFQQGNYQFKTWNRGNACHQTSKPAGACSQVSGQKGATPKSNHAPQATDQLPQEPFQSGEE